jgi:hypothetical protein
MRTLVYATLIVGGVFAPSAAFSQATVVTVPSEVETYVTKESVPSVKVEREVIVGSELPDTVTLRRVPKHDNYSFAVVNNRRVIVEAKSRKVVKIID